MTAAYWNQWSKAEILSLHGIDMEEKETDFNEENEEFEGTQDKCDSPISMDTLGLSWRDFY